MKGCFVRGMLCVLLLLLAVAACGGSHTALPPPTKTPVPTNPPPQPTATVTRTLARVSARYRAFLDSACHAFATRDSNALASDLSNYQYNNGLRYGMLGDGEGQTGDPSLFSTWLAHGPVACVSYSPDVAGHGTLLTRGWPLGGGWGLIDLDIFNGSWKFNDFTFGTRNALISAMATSHPILQFRAQKA